MAQDMYDSLKMWDTTLMTHIDIQLAEITMKEFQIVTKIMEGSETEYEGR